ncbi:hypothetical protein T492DRAFT_893112, partial [Pavlovales sp. CCMP2436]
MYPAGTQRLAGTQRWTDTPRRTGTLRAGRDAPHWGRRRAGRKGGARHARGAGGVAAAGFALAALAAPLAAPPVAVARAFAGGVAAPLVARSVVHSSPRLDTLRTRSPRGGPSLAPADALLDGVEASEFDADKFVAALKKNVVELGLPCEVQLSKEDELDAGKFSDAAKLLESHGLANISDPVVLQQMLTKHPRRRTAMPPVIPGLDATDRLVVGILEMQESYRGLKTDKAQGA